MNGGRAVHRDVRNDLPLHQVDKERRQPGFHDVAAQHHDHAFVRARGRDDRVDDAQEISGDEDVGQRAKKVVERRARDRGRGKLRCTDFVRPARDGHRANGGEIRLGNLGGGQGLSVGGPDVGGR